ncbi:hypothetical protein BHM03_00015131 [Ensete ventricosum]|nr:hypothetical protein BHM03_00015131 [Ensete ventricosum]
MTWHEGPVTLTRGDGSASFATTAPPVLRLCLGSRDARDDASSNGRDSVPFGRICPVAIGLIGTHRRCQPDLVPAECVSSPASVGIEISDSGWVRSSEVNALASARLSARLLCSASAPKILHKVLVRGGGWEVACTLGLTSAVTSGIVESYGGLVVAEVWGEGMTRHAALMARGGGVGLARRPDPSTSDADVTVDLAAKLEHTQLHLRC